MAGQGGLGFLETPPVRKHSGELAAHLHAPGLAALGCAHPASALRTADEQYPAVEVHIPPLEGHRFAEPDAQRARQRTNA